MKYTAVTRFSICKTLLLHVAGLLPKRLRYNESFVWLKSKCNEFLAVSRFFNVPFSSFFPSPPECIQRSYLVWTHSYLMRAEEILTRLEFKRSAVEIVLNFNVV